MLKLRVHGPLPDIKEYTESLRQDKSMRLLSVSEPYKNRGESEYYRIYIDAEVLENGDRQ
jgi:hypothetical protein